jgi:formylglycine-generating enzyme required for sulfatase activity
VRLASEGLIQEHAHVVRGGSWNNNRNNARCSYRNRNEPDNFNNNIGFRVVCSTSFLYAGNAAHPTMLRRGFS